MQVHIHAYSQICYILERPLLYLFYFINQLPAVGIPLNIAQIVLANAKCPSEPFYPIKNIQFTVFFFVKKIA